MQGAAQHPRVDMPAVVDRGATISLETDPAWPGWVILVITRRRVRRIWLRNDEAAYAASLISNHLAPAGG